MKKIAIDVDDVISPFFQAFIDFHNKYYNTSILPSDIKYKGEYRDYWKYALSETIGISENESAERFIVYLNSDHHSSGQTITDDAKNALAVLKDRFELEIITARNYSEETIKWINSAVPDTFNDMHFISNRNTTTKADVCISIGADYLIDDSVEHCNLAAEAGIKVLLFGNYGWNSNQKLHKDIVKVRNWREVISFFENE